MRTIIDLPEEQLLALDRLREKTRRSRTSLIREAVVRYVKDSESPDLRDLPGFGCWRGAGEEGLTYQLGLREEWKR